MLSGDTVWCTRCGSYADTVAKGLAKPCRGKAQGKLIGGGLVRQLKVLMSGRHPRTLAVLPPPLPEPRWHSSGAIETGTARHNSQVCAVDVCHRPSSSQHQPGSGCCSNGQLATGAGVGRGARPDAPTRAQALLMRVRAKEATCRAASAAEGVGLLGCNAGLADRHSIAGKRPVAAVACDTAAQAFKRQRLLG